MYLFFDTETADKPRNWKAPASDLDNWPRLVQIGWICCDRTGRASGSGDYLIQPEGFTIARGATAVHGITTQRARQEGVELEPVLEEFVRVVRKARILVAHNMDFDQKVIQAEFFRTGMVSPMAGKTWCCTMKESTGFCRLPGPYGYKWPYGRVVPDSVRRTLRRSPQCSCGCGSLYEMLLRAQRDRGYWVRGGSEGV